MDTIFALSTPPGRGGVSVIRVSGPDVIRVCDRFSLEKLVPRMASVRLVKDKDDVLDEALVLLFEPGKSFTGEATLELQLHGSLAVKNALMSRLAKVPGCRPAEPGEFTRRALENGRMDLTEVEGLGDLLEAETEAQRKQAQRVLSGGIGRLVDRWRDDMIHALALLEVTIDFADEDVPVDVKPDVLRLVEGVSKDLEREISGIGVAERVRDGFEVAIVGAPNAGKSTLLNALAGRTAALTSDFAGTTRDVIEVRMDVKGIPVTFLDTAGLRASDDVVEAMGIELAASRAANADLRIFLESSDSIPDVVVGKPDDIYIQGKADLFDSDVLAVSGLTGQGIPQLVDLVYTALRDRLANVGTATNVRHKFALEAAQSHLVVAFDMAQSADGAEEIVAEELRRGMGALDQLIGRVDVENVLDKIFSSFCLGK